MSRTINTGFILYGIIDSDPSTSYTFIAGNFWNEFTLYFGSYFTIDAIKLLPGTFELYNHKYADEDLMTPEQITVSDIREYDRHVLQFSGGKLHTSAGSIKLELEQPLTVCRLNFRFTGPGKKGNELFSFSEMKQWNPGNEKVQYSFFRCIRR